MNFYLTDFPDNEELIHIGRLSHNCPFLFHGSHKIRSWQDWHNEILVGDFLIVNEEMKVMLLFDFIELIDRNKNRTAPIEGCDDKDKGDYWIDSNGFYFTSKEFS